MARKLSIEIKEGVCTNEKFIKMLEANQLVTDKVDEHLNETLVIVGVAKANIKTDDKEFDMYYYVAKNGTILSSGSEYLYNSLANTTMGDEVVLKKVKTKRGHTYIFNPIFNIKDIVTDDDLPF